MPFVWENVNKNVGDMGKAPKRGPLGGPADENFIFSSIRFQRSRGEPRDLSLPPIVRVGGAYGAIARARSSLRSGDLGFTPLTQV